MDLFLAVIGALDDWIVRSIVGSIVGSILGSIVGELSLFLLFQFSVVDDRSAAAGTVIYMPLIGYLPRLQEDGEVMEHFLVPNIVVCPPKSNWVIHRRESRTVGVWRAST